MGNRSGRVWCWLSADGHSLAFLTFQREGDLTRLWYLDLTTDRAPPTLVARAYIIYADWSPDGRRLAFMTVTSLSDPRWQVWLWDRVSQKRQAITPAETDHSYHFVSWSPDGRWIAVSSPAKKVEVINVRDPARVLGPWRSSLHVLRPKWSVNPPEIFFVASPSKIARIRIAASGSANERIMRVRDSHYDVYPSPDGKWLIRTAMGALGREARLLSLADHSEMLITRSHYRRPPVVWSPQSTEFALLEGDKRSSHATLWRVNAASGAKARIAEDVTGLLDQNSWTATGLIFFLRGNDIWSVKPDGAGERQVLDASAVLKSVSRRLATR